MGALLHYTHTASTSQYVLNANTFFLFLLPPIIYDAGYHMPLRAFFNNLGTILLLAVVNTLWNTIAIGISLWAMSYIGWIGRKISLLHCFMFSALISAVDPVAVLAVFEDVHVNEMLYIIVFGESLLNDGVTVVLYHMMEGFAEIGESNIEPVDYAAGVGSFFIIALGGTLIGMIYGMVGGFITKYTDHVRVIEPLFVFVLGYLAYLTSEMMHLSGILALSFGGITMRHYVEANMNEKSVTAVKYTMKMMANVSETVIFMFLGLSTVVDTLDWQWDFIFFALIFCIIYRVVGIVCLIFVMNRRRVIQLTSIDQFIMSYGGLRGGIAFCLSLLINEDIVREKNMFVTTTIIVVFFTVFVQGITIKPVVNALKVKRQGEKDPSMNEMLHERLIDHLMAGMEDIVGRTSHNSIKNRSNGDVYFAPPGTVLDIQSVEAVYSKRDADDTYMHHLLEDAMFPPRKAAPSWADNLAYNHLTESGSPYVSPENTINAGQKAESRRPVFDIFPPTPDVASPGSDTSPAKDKEEAIHDPIPPPWASHMSEGIVLVSEGIVLVSEGIVLVSEGIVLVSEGIVLVSEGIVLVSEGIVLVSEGIVLVSEGIVLVSEGIVLVSEGIVLVSEGIVLVSEGIVLVSEGIVLVSEGIVLVSEGIVLVSEGIVLVSEGIVLVSEGIVLVSEGIVLVSEGIVLVSEGIVLVSEGIVLVSEGIVLVSEGIVLVSEGIVLVSEGIVLVSEGIVLVSEGIVL
nr:hypothetical protein BaRGS_033966 [Batillaria attramentaria]